MSTGRVVIFSGPSGVGKSTVLRQVLENHPDYFFSVSATTRAPRPGETPGVSYHYITPEEFQDLLRQDALMEYNLYAGGDYYGTPAQPVYDVLARGGTAILDVDPKGAAQVLARGIHAKWPEAKVRILPCAGLCSFYAQDQGIIITY